MDSFKYILYMEIIKSKDGSTDSEIKKRLAQATQAMVRLTTIWTSKDIRLKLKYNLHRSLVLSILTYEYEYWTISAISTKIQGIKNNSYIKLLGITYTEIKINEYIKDVMISLIDKFNWYI